jgi:hypothetical protein
MAAPRAGRPQEITTLGGWLAQKYPNVGRWYVAGYFDFVNRNGWYIQWRHLPRKTWNKN